MFDDDDDNEFAFDDGEELILIVDDDNEPAFNEHESKLLTCTCTFDIS